GTHTERCDRVSQHGNQRDSDRCGDSPHMYLVTAMGLTPPPGDQTPSAGQRLLAKATDLRRGGMPTYDHPCLFNATERVGKFCVFEQLGFERRLVELCPRLERTAREHF